MCVVLTLACATSEATYSRLHRVWILLQLLQLLLLRVHGVLHPRSDPRLTSCFLLLVQQVAHDIVQSKRLMAPVPFAVPVKRNVLWAAYAYVFTLKTVTPFKVVPNI